MAPSRAGSRPDLFTNLEKLDELDDDGLAQQTLAALRDALSREMKIKEGSENMLEALNTKKAKQTKEQRQRVEAELNSSNIRIKDLRQKISDAQRSKATPTTPIRSRTEDMFSRNGLRSPPSASRSGADSPFEEPTESPTFALAEILQALEVEGMAPEYYVARANNLVDLFKRYPTLKYDLVWSVFGLRMQVMLLSESREVVAAGYRMTRYAMSDASSLKKIRTLNTDYIVVSSLIKDRKADLEREQALKFVRAFLDIKDGIREVSRAVVRTVAAIAEQPEDRLRPICLETLAEILVKDPRLLLASGGLSPLSEALAEGSYKAPESLTAAFLFLLDVPRKRKYLRAGYELEVLFTAFTDHFLTNEAILKQNSKAVASSLKTWSGLMNLSMFDFRAIRQLLIDSGVLSHSNYTKWNWEVVLKIIEGPLVNGKRLEEAIKASKFIKRMMSFYRPFKYKFSEIKNTRNTQRYVRVGCALMHTLLQSPQGIAYLADNKLLRQVAECLAQCDPTSGLTAQFPMFSKDRLTDTLCGGYFPMLGVLSGDPKGLQMLDRWRMFNMMYHIVDLKQRPDLIKLLLTNFDYTLQGHPRVLLSKALTAGTKDIRIHATNALRKYATSPRLYDPDVEVCATAVKILEKACNTKNYLEYIVECRPALDHLGEIGAPLLLRFLSTSIGYHYLDGLDYISNEMDDWFLGRNDTYVGVIEASLARAFGETAEDQSHRVSLFEEEPDLEADSHVPPHFYRELTRTQEGCKLLRDKGHFDEFATTIRDYGMQYDDRELMTKVKGSMWAVGNVGSMELGAPFLESCDVVERIIKIAETHEVMSLRGTAFFVLGLISRSVHGLEILSEQGWDSNTNTLGASLGFCIPSDLSKFFSLKPWKHETATSVVVADTQKTETVEPPAMPSRPRSESLLAVLTDDLIAGSADMHEHQVVLDPDPTNQKILELYIDLGNSVLFNRARNELLQLKQQKKAPGFRQPQMFRKVISLMESRHFRLNGRRMLELFERSVLRQVVFDEESDSEEEDEMGGGGGSRIVEDPEEYDEDDDSDDFERGDESSGDEQRTERQRSVSDAADLERSNTVRRATVSTT
ncbi:putative cytosolic regulator pianissimo protein [Phaeoacremonium minimum UCRPA7]|uniref:Putative cytosolic regulator pianissimo protein n=1 Tax=Phaeoacremonium minimum (strain UCR-PA7) TaxID=1286976 RepID=R8BMS7_PHAM7|nr:putative cytosolic regulator pianissimo protein [Phaeoacremonium minimum UCRPA7]EOO00642.1 putative cytosolic regulator pianissimo protein [Phaeoacremonium minimum UCRPA7]